MLQALSLVAAWSLGLAVPIVSRAESAPSDQATTSFDSVIGEYCLHCHSGDRPKGQFDMTNIGDGREARAAVLRAMRDRLRRGDMPPPGKERPDAETYAAAVAYLNAALDERAARASPGRPTIRRLNRVEFRNTVRDLIGVDVDVASALPADDVGEGFDQIGDVLSMAPTLLEKYLDIAERAALRAWPDVLSPTEREFAGEQLVVRSGGRAMAHEAVVWSAGEASVAYDAPRGGRYRIRVNGFGDQAGPEPVKIAVKIGKERIEYFDLPEKRESPGERTCEVTFEIGRRDVAVEFLNDFYREDLPEGRRDRNLHVLGITIIGPLDAATPTREALSLAGRAPTLDAFSLSLLGRAFRRPPTDAEVTEFVGRVRRAVPSDAAWPLVARTALTAALVDPRFLFRVEADPADGAAVRALDDYEIATRLSYACWSSMPDAELFEAARRGELRSRDGRRAALSRLLDDPRSLALAENFGQQWLLIRNVDERQPDARRFPGVDPALLRDMKAETTLFVDRMLRQGRPLRELLIADWTYLNDRLARHYGIDGVDGDWMRLVHIGDRRVPGILGHGSMLVATSNPTRTSPVKRGKWVLDALLDAPPAPPPPGVPPLPDKVAAAGATSMRELLARHRADPACAACHQRMDSYGLALETLDAVGRERFAEQGDAIDATADLPGGRHVNGPRELSAMLSDDPALVRSVVRHLFVYALGRPMTEADDAVVDSMARHLTPQSSLADALAAIVESDAFRLRAAAQEATR
ncbi:MAG: DUF1592 domain-containing protein [Phycisphaerales bacterium]